MSIIMTNCCGKMIDLDFKSDDVVYREKENDVICYDCAEEMELLCPECGEYKPDKHCTCKEAL